MWESGTRYYGGSKSNDFWDAVRAHDDTQGRLYTLALILQQVEAHVCAEIEASRVLKKAKRRKKADAPKE